VRSIDGYFLIKPEDLAWRPSNTMKIVSALSIFGLLLGASSLASGANAPVARNGFITANGIKLHYIDWGGRGETILFLTGFDDSAHVYDDFAPQFTDRFHVIGLTRRGVGESDKPADGYDASTRVEDIRQFLDALNISKVSLIGHSMAGDELTLFATRYPERTAKVVYFDAAYDRTPEGWLAGLSDPTNKPGMVQRARMEALGMPEASKIHVERMPPPDQWAILVAMHKAIFAFRQDYTKVQAPALAFYAVTASEHYPSRWLPKNADENLRAKAEAWWKEKGHLLMREQVEKFRREIPHGEIVELNDAKHYLFTGDAANEVASRTRKFLLKP
jgi:pimeloyl-ACP methyl ester carboxylesterase